MDKEVLPHFGKRTLKAIGPTDLRILCEQIRDRGKNSRLIPDYLYDNDYYLRYMAGMWHRCFLADGHYAFYRLFCRE